MLSQLRSLSVEAYLALAAKAGRQIIIQPDGHWQCMECVGQDPYGRKRHDCPVCRGHGGVVAPAPSVERTVPPEQQWGTSGFQRYSNLRQAQWAQMAELLRSGRLRW